MKGPRACMRHTFPSPQACSTNMQRYCHLQPKLLTPKAPYRLGARHPDLNPRLFRHHTSLPGECSAGITAHRWLWQGAQQSQTPFPDWVPPRDTVQVRSAPTAPRIAGKGGVKVTPQLNPHRAVIRLVAQLLPPAVCTRLGSRWTAWGGQQRYLCAEGR